MIVGLLHKGDSMQTIKNKNGTIRYREQIWINGTCYKSPCFERKTDAKAWKVHKTSELQKRKALGDDARYSEKVLFVDYGKKWLEEVVKVDRAAKTYRNYEANFRVHLAPFFAKKTLQEITESDGRKLLLKLRETGHMGKGINNVITLLKTILNRAMREMYIARNPLLNLPKQKEDLKTDAFWTKMEIQQFLLANKNNSLYPLFLVALHTGMRMAELCGLCFDRVDFSRNEIHITRVRDKDGLRETTKTGLKRIVPMLPIVRVILLDLFQKNENGTFVFTDTKKRPVDYGHLYREFKKAQKKAQMVKFLAFHDMRHTFASQFVMNGGSIFDLQKILGHTDIKMTMRYSHFLPEHLQSAIGFMNMGVELDKDFSSSYPESRQRENLEDSDNVVMLG